MLWESLEKLGLELFVKEPVRFMHFLTTRYYLSI